jgi:nitroreductase
MDSPWVLDEDDALDLLAFLVTAARTQVDEAREYGPMRLLMAAHRLAEAMAPRSSAYGFRPHVTGPYVDVGTALATILLAAHATGIGASPVTSFSRTAVAAVLRLAPGWTAEVLVGLGHPAAVQPPPFARSPRLTWEDLTTRVPQGG